MTSLAIQGEHYTGHIKLIDRHFSFQYLSDIGGTAGLVLGLSIASILKHMEQLFYTNRGKATLCKY